MALLNSVFQPRGQAHEAQRLYIALARQSRNPFFYRDCDVPDTLDGRFDMLLLHIFLAFRLSLGGQTVAPAPAAPPRASRGVVAKNSSIVTTHDPELRRLLLECFIDDMDRSLRELGVGDMGVPKRIKAMAKAAFGRFAAYEAAGSSEDAWREALIRNVWRGNAPASPALSALLDYTKEYTLPVIE